MVLSWVLKKMRYLKKLRDKRHNKQFIFILYFLKNKSYEMTFSLFSFSSFPFPS